MAREPVVASNLLGALVLAVCGLLQQFGVPLTDGQQHSITTVAGLLILLASAVIARRYTTVLSDPRNHHGQLLTPEAPTLGSPASGDDPSPNR